MKKSEMKIENLTKLSSNAVSDSIILGSVGP